MKKLLLAILASTTLCNAQPTHEGMGGLVVMEAENTASPLGQWTLETSVPGYHGSGYLEFNGNDYELGPAVSPLEYTFRVNQSGLYYLHLHCARENVVIDGETRTDLANDCYVRVDGDYGAGPNAGETHGQDASLEILKRDTKFFGGADKRFDWAFGTTHGGRLDPGGRKNKRVAIYAFKAGQTYTLVVHGRSRAFKLDRIVFALTQVDPSVAHDPMQGETLAIPAGTRFTYRAVDDFDDSDQAEVPYYVDKGNDALAINARKTSNRTGFARASLPFGEATGVYDATLTTLTEEDGESTYRMLVNGTVVGIFRNPHIGAGSALDMAPHRTTFYGLQLVTGDTVSIESTAHTNGEIPEGDGTAWSRGRWSELEITRTGFLVAPRPSFSKRNDILVAQFDSKPDADDIHAQAAIGSMLAHPDLSGVNYIAVSGATGIQSGEYIDSSSLFNLAFGEKGTDWVDAHGNWEEAVSIIRDRAMEVINAGGKVWVQEAGQSGFTRDWVEALLRKGYSETLLRNSVIVVQHSKWNEDMTKPEDLAFVKASTGYRAIDDGNSIPGDYSQSAARGDQTPGYTSPSRLWLELAKSDSNQSEHVRSLWKEAGRIIESAGFEAAYSTIPGGGVDFSDCVENWWIFAIGSKADTVQAFWKRYVYMSPDSLIRPPAGRLAIVADGNSPDPDDIGATAVMFGLLKSAGLADRLVHLSHSCDLNPLSTSSHYVIGASDELRRQEKLHDLCREGIERFGPFPSIKGYFNCRREQAAAINDLCAAINASTDLDPLWIIEAGEPDIIGFALQAADPSKAAHVHVVSHHPANDNGGDFFRWKQIIDFGVTEHQIGDQNVGLQTAITEWDWARDHSHPGIAWIWSNLQYAEQDGVVPFQAGKFDCSDAGMVYWWITGAHFGGNRHATPAEMKELLLHQD